MTDVRVQLDRLEAIAEVARLGVRVAVGTPDLELRLAEYRRAMDAVCTVRIQLRRASRRRTNDADVRRPLELRP